MITLPLRIDNSMIETWEACPRKFFYRYVLDKDVTVPSVALSFGSAVHQVLYEYRRTGSVELAAKRAFDIELVEDERRNRARLVEILETYAKRYPIDSEPIELLITPDGFKLLEVKGSVNIPFEGELHGVPVKEFTYFGTIDMVGIERGTDTSPLIIDYKTCSLDLEGGAGTEAFFKKWSLSSQMMGYYKIVHSLGIRPRGVLIDAIGNTARKVTMMRRIITFQQYQIDEWEDNLKRKVADILNICNSGISQMHTSSCYSFNSRCAYYDVCSSPKEVRERILTQYPERVWNEE